MVRDQEVEGSNSFAPTISFRTNNLRTQHIRRPPDLGPGGQRSDVIEPIALICTGPLYMYAPHAPAFAPSGVFQVVSATKCLRLGGPIRVV